VPSRILHRLLAVATLALLFSGRADAATIVIDDFSGPVSGAATTGAPPATVTTTSPGFNLAPGLLPQRTFTIQKTSGSEGRIAGIGVSGGELVFNNATGVSSIASVEYDAATFLNLSGLTSISFDAIANDGGAALPAQETPGTITFITPDGEFTAGFTVPLVNFPVPVTVPVGNFGPGFDPSEVTGIRITFNGTNSTGIDLSIDNLRVDVQPTNVIPEPTSFACLAGGVGCFAVFRRLRRKAAPR